MSSVAGLSVRTFRELVRLYARRLSEARFSQLARALSILISFGAVTAIVVVRVSEGPSAPTAKLATGATRAAMWLVGVAIALAASHERSLADRRDGIDVLALGRGVEGSRLTLVRAVAAFSLIAKWMLVPAVSTALAAVATSGSGAALALRSGVLVSVVLFSFAAAAVLGPLAVVADALAPKRGRSLFLLVLVATAFLAEIGNDPALSVTGGLATLLNGLLHLFGAAKLL